MISLVDLNNERIAIVLQREGQTVVLTGVGMTANDPTLGSVLRVELDEEDGSLSNPALVIPEADIETLVHRQSVNGCDYCITLG